MPNCSCWGSPPSSPRWHFCIVEANQEQGLRWDLATYTVAYLALFAGAHLAIRRFAPYADPLLLPVVALLNGLGLVMIHRLDLAAGELTSGGLRGPSANQQMLWTLVGVIGFSLGGDLSARPPAAGALRLRLRPHRPDPAGDSRCRCPDRCPSRTAPRSGFELPGFSIQPAEFSKILLLIFFAAVLVSKRSVFTSAGKHFLGMDLPRPRDLAPLLAAWIISVGVMIFEKDLGTSLLLYASFLVLVYVATERFSWVVIGLALFAAGSVAAYYVFAHVQIRVQTWLDPFADPDGAGYQMVQSLFSFATGGIFGTGLGNGQPGTVPAASTDFIIAAVGEELGLVGLAGVLMLYTIVIIRGLRTAIAVRDSFGKLLAAGLASTLAIQLFIVVGGVTKLIPLTGLTTPWMSYGGSSLLANYVLLAILVRISHAARRPIVTRPPNTDVDRGGQHRGDREAYEHLAAPHRRHDHGADRAAAGQRHLTQVFTADGLRADPRNQRVLLDEYSRQRGQISAGGQLLAYSVSTDGRFRFLRVYPNPFDVRARHRLLLAALFEHRAGARRGHHPQRVRRAAVRPAAGRLLHRPRPARRQRRRPPSIPRCSRRRGTRWRTAATGRARARWSRWSRRPARSWRWCRRRPTTRTCWPRHDVDEQTAGVAAAARQPRNRRC